MATKATLATATYNPYDLVGSAVQRRAVEAVIWGIPMVNYDLLFQSVLRAGGAANQVVYWSRLPDWKNQTLTPNPDVIYVFPFLNTKSAGPMVMEIPPAGPDGSFTGSVDDAWQTAIEDVGPAGVDKGAGGKYLILPPDYKEKIPAGYIPMPSNTYQSYAVLRSNLASGSDEDVAQAVVYGKRVKIYPLSQAANPPETVFVDAVDVVFDNIIRYDLSFFQSLNRMVQAEPWLERDKAMIDSLQTIGIEKGRKFEIDPKTKQNLEIAIAEAHAYLDLRYEEAFNPPFDPSARWAMPALPEFAKAIMNNYTLPGKYPVDGRGLAYSYAYFSAKHLGAGQYYLMTTRDGNGEKLAGANTYSLNVPPNPPVKLYWSSTIYNRETHAVIRDKKWSSRSSNTPGLQQNADGSVNLYFGPTAPAGKESNWVPTDAKGRFEVLFRLYGPEKRFFEKKWLLPDIEKIG